MGKMNVLFYDTQMKRAWLVDGASALLHMSRAWLSSENAQSALTASQDPSTYFDHPPTSAGCEASVSALLSKHTRGICLYTRGPKETVDETAQGEIRPTGSKMVVKSTEFTWEDIVSEK